MYYRNGKTIEFTKILGEALKDVNSRDYPYLFNSIDDRIKALNALASFNIQMAQTEPNEDNANRVMDIGRSLIGYADNLNIKAPISFITKSFCALTSG